MILFIRGAVHPKDMAEVSFKAADITDDVLTRWDEATDPDGNEGLLLTFTGEDATVQQFREVWRSEMQQRGYHVEID